ncbi:MAG: hypothetical protein ACREA2_23165, partial [Blastocatellia bacterium]
AGAQDELKLAQPPEGGTLNAITEKFTGRKNARQKNKEHPDVLYFSVSHFFVWSSSLACGFHL